MTRVALGLCLLAAAQAAAPNPAALLQQFDAVRNGWNSFVVRVRISNYEEGQQDEEHVFQVYQKGPERSYVEFLSPREKGRHLLMLGDDMWIYLPDTSRPIRITPIERLTGNASNGDVARTNYAADYDPVYLRLETLNAVACHVLELTAKRKAATYRKVHLWLRADTGRPVKADFFVASGRQFKTATYDRYGEVSGHLMLRRMTIYDQVRKNSRSVIEYLEITPRALPDRLFHQGRTERF
ncbi:MAG: outer membrane lipoprotein-sorting protein [Bryobacteraceae bacterium]